MIYLFCICIASILAFVAEKKNDKRALFFAAFVLSLFCGLRGLEVGVDTVNYFNFLSYIRILGIEFGSDIGFSVVSYILMGIFDNPHIPLLIFAVVTNYLIIYRLWDFKDKASFGMMVIVYILIHYPYTFNIVRQFLAIAIVFWATRYIEREKYTKYILLNLLAASFHTSALVCFAYLFVKRGFKSDKKMYRYMGICIATVFVGVGICLFSENVQKYAQYFTQTSTGIHAMTILKIVCVILIVVCNKIYKNPTFSYTTSKELAPMNHEVATMYLMGLLLAALGMFFSFMNRIGFYFLIYEMPFWGQVVRSRVNKNYYRLMIFAILGYVLFSTLLTDTSGLMNYTSFIS